MAGSDCTSALGAAAVDVRPALLALGVLSAQSSVQSRRWLRRHFARLPISTGWHWHFVLGTPSRESLPCWRLCFHPDNGQEAQAARLIAAQCASLAAEQADSHDLLFVPAADNEAVGCIDKSFAWFSHATLAYPRARYVAVTQDDAVVFPPNLEPVLQELRPHRLVCELP